MVLVSVSVSVPQENCPAFHTSLPVVGSQVWSPAPWNELAVNPLDIERDPPKELDDVEFPIEA